MQHPVIVKNSLIGAKMPNSTVAEDFRKIFKEFCEAISLHGYSYLYLSSLVIAKIFWALAIIVCTFLGGGFLYSSTKSYINARIVTTIESSTASLDVRYSQDLICGTRWSTQICPVN